MPSLSIHSDGFSEAHYIPLTTFNKVAIQFFFNSDNELIISLRDFISYQFLFSLANWQRPMHLIFSSFMRAIHNN